MIFKCKNCEGNVIYSPEKHAMFCPYCESEGSEERREYTESDLKICPNCGGEVPVEEHTSATKCPYCDNYLILNPRVEGEYTPALIIPFKLGKENCKETLREKFKRCVFAPTDFLSEARLNSMEGDYVPFWFYDYDANCDFQGEGTKVRTWRSGNTEYTETSYYNVVRNMDVDFRKIPVDASEKMPDDVMDLLEPYDYKGLEAFKPEFLSGFMGEKYNVVSSLVENRAEVKMESSVNKMMRESYSNSYLNVRPVHNRISKRNSAAHFGLLPVWKYIYTYKDKQYPFYINGQTGKIVGTAPISAKKVWFYAGTIWACLVTILAMLNVIVM